jgi:protein-disulfide isomerase
MKIKADAIVNGILVLCAIVITGFVARREFKQPPTTTTAQNLPTESTPIYISNWRTHILDGHLMGSSAAPVQLVEFADFECPFCATFHNNVKVLRERYPAQIALTYVHFPLSGHRFAEPAARVAECAGEQGHFESMYDRLFDHQESFGLKPWDEFATEAGVPDRAAFDTCIRSTGPIPRVAEGKSLGKELDVQGTPTLIINGWKLGHPPNPEELDVMVKAILAGKDPVSGGRKS